MLNCGPYIQELKVLPRPTTCRDHCLWVRLDGAVERSQEKGRRRIERY
jgi:hypothetical protein